MVRYEDLILVVPEITNEEIAKLETLFNKMVKTAKGNVLSFEKWGKYKLAYQVRKNDYGVYFLTRFELPKEEKDKFFATLKDLFAIKYYDLVMRHMVSVLPSDKSLDYQRPRSLEEAPKEVEFLKKTKDISDLGISTKEISVSDDEENGIA